MPEPSLLERLKQRKIIQWALAYLAGAWVVVQLLDAVKDPVGLSQVVHRGILAILAVGFLLTLVLAWYHGEKGRQRVSGPELLMVAALLVVAGAALTWVTGPSGDPSARPRPSEGDTPRIAILPCENRSADPEDRQIASTLHDEILLELQKVSSFESIGRSSVLHYAEAPPATSVIASELGVSFVGECSVQKYGDQIRLIFHVLDGRTGVETWGEPFEQTLTSANLSAVFRQIAQEVALALQVELTPEDQGRIATKEPTEDDEAYELFLRARYFRSQVGGVEGLEEARRLLQQATEIDPAFALAFAELSDVIGRLYFLWAVDRSEAALHSQEAAANRALALDPDLPEAWKAAAYVHYTRRDFPKALEQYSFALEGAPNDVGLILFLGYTHRRLGNWPEAFAAFETASRLDPRNRSVFYDLGGNTFMWTHRYRDAVSAFDRALAIDPNHADAAWGKGFAYCNLLGNLDTLRAMFDQTPSVPGTNRWWLRIYERDIDAARSVLPSGADEVLLDQTIVETKSLRSAWVNWVEGDEEAALASFDSARVRLEEWERANPGDPRVHPALAFAYAGLGQSADAAERTQRNVQAYVGDVVDALDAARDATFALAMAGFKEEAIELLEQNLQGPSTLHYCQAKYDFRLDPIRDDPRFKALLEQYAPRVER